MSQDARKTDTAVEQDGPTRSSSPSAPADRQRPDRPTHQSLDSQPEPSDSPADSSADSQTASAPADEQAAPDRLSGILSMKVPVIVKVAEKQMAMADILKLDLGAVIHFETDAYQHVDLMINNHTIGRGQPVKVGEKFGLRVVEIGEVTDTIRSLASTPTSDGRTADD